MFSVPRLYEMGRSCPDSNYHFRAGKFMTTSAKDDENGVRSMAGSCSSHKEAERRRRKRINDHFVTLKTILPNTIKKDKASLLGEAVRRVRELKKEAAELMADMDDDILINNMNSSETTLKSLMLIPIETDELRVSHCNDDSGLIKAVLCCEDRPEIVVELIEALKSAEAKVVRTEMSTVGGRTKSVLWVRRMQGDGGLEMLRRALKMVMDKPILFAGSGQALSGNKRPRCFLPCDSMAFNTS